MTAYLLRIIVFAVIAVAVWWGVRRIWRDWKKQFSALDKARHQRDLHERDRPDVVTLRRDKDGRFRPPEE